MCLFSGELNASLTAIYNTMSEMQVWLEQVPNHEALCMASLELVQSNISHLVHLLIYRASKQWTNLQGN